MENRVAGAQASQASPRSSISALVQCTPGPWIVTEPHGSVGHVSRSEDGFGDICTTWNGNAQANARLIAAAPEMYEALKAARLYVECCTEPNTPAEEALALLDAALRKAEGGV
jgi:hypothetical protein